MKKIASHTKNEQLKNILRDDIMKGRFLPGHKIPSQNELKEKYNIGHNTAREAISALVHEGLLYSIQGKGTFVAEWQKSVNTKYPVAFIHELTRDALLTKIHYVTLTDFLANEANRSGYSFQLYQKPQYLESLMDNENIALKEVLIKKELSGYIIFVAKPSLLWNEIRRIGLPFVCLGSSSKSETIPNRIIIDGIQAGYTGAKYLLELGYARIGILARYKEENPFLEGCCRAFSEKRQPLSNVLIAGRLSEIVRQVEAVYITEDYLAIQELPYLLEHEIKVPERLGVLVFANKGININFPVKLSIIEIDPLEEGKRAWELLRSQIENGMRNEEPVFISCELREGESCRKKSG